MTNQVKVTSHISIKVGGTELPINYYRNLLEVVVDQHVHLPAMFHIRLHDPDLKLLDQGPFDLTKSIEIASKDDKGKPVRLLNGEIIAIAPEFNAGMVAELVVSGYDRLHRLYREVKSKTYLNVKDSDIANQIARAAGLQAEIEPTITVYDHLYQRNQSDLTFLRSRASRIGYECFIDGEKLIFRKLAVEKAQLSLTWGQDLHWFHPRLTLAEQVEEVVVKGWDVQKKAAITGRATKGQLYAQIQEQKDGAQWSSELGKGSKVVIVDHPVISQAEADILATARLNEISGVFVEAEGEAFRRPELCAGRAIQLMALGKRFSGVYLVTSATHVYTNTGFKTNFSVRGARTGLLSDLLTRHTLYEPQGGVVTAIVTNSDDPNGWGRVKVKFPWMADNEESDWARVVGAGAGTTAGFCSLPAINDEVLVGFAHGDFSQPIILGGLWNGQDALPPQVSEAAEGEKPKVRTWQTPQGHHITIYDNAENKIEIATANGLSIALNDAKQTIELRSDGTISIEAKGDVNITGKSINLN